MSDVGAVCAALVLLTLAGCGHGPPAARATSASSARAAAPSPTDRLCGDPALNDRQVTFPSTDVYLTGYQLGAGRTTLVLAAQSMADGCSWLPYAKQQAAKGYRVLAFDFHSEGRSQHGGNATNSADVQAAAQYARVHGASSVALIGASRGATAVLVAAAKLTPPVTAVISLSAHGYYAGESALDAVPNLKVPVLYLAATGDASAAGDAHALYDATPAPHRKVVIVPGGLHGLGFVLTSAEGATQATDAIDAFVAEWAPAA